MSLSYWETALGIIVAILVLGVILYTFGYLASSPGIEKTGKNTGWIAISGLIVLLIVYWKVKEYELEAKEINVLNKFLSN